MAAASYIALAAATLLLLPVVILPWEGRRVPGWLYAALALTGLLPAALRGGLEAVMWAVIAGAATLAAVTLLVGTIRALAHLQVLTGGHIKLLCAGAVWLGPWGAALMVCGAFAVLFALAALRRYWPGTRPPDFSAIAAVAILCVGVQQAAPEQALAAADVIRR